MINTHTSPSPALIIDYTPHQAKELYREDEDGQVITLQNKEEEMYSRKGVNIRINNQGFINIYFRTSFYSIIDPIYLRGYFMAQKIRLINFFKIMLL